jgi:hypothetical protein
MRSSFLSLTLAFALLSLPACFLDDDSTTHSSPSSSTRAFPSAPSCDETRPQILGLDMAPSAQISSEGDYDITGTIRYSCSGVSVQAHVFSPDGVVRWAPSPNATGAPATLSLRFAGSQKGQTVQYEITVLDADGNESYPPLRQSAALE